MGHSAWEMKTQEEFFNTQCPMPNTQCPMPNTQFPIPNAQFPMPNYEVDKRLVSIVNNLVANVIE
ncbi:hypothetical protein [Nostoc sp.]|uniref:hypothetical protein n=1 Tax=Nostoc sp. TaxID=1180 RepID=UPI002FF6BA72